MGCGPSAFEAPESRELVQADLGGAVISAPRAPSEWSPGPPDLFNMTIERKALEVLGLDVGNTAGNKTGAVILNIWENGLLNKWSTNHPENPLKIGHIIVEVNQARGFWEVFEQIGQVGVLNMVIQRNPPKQGWHDEVAHLGQALQRRGSSGSLRLRLSPSTSKGDQKSVEKTAEALTCLPNVRAGDCGATQCCICISDLEPHEQLVQLPCKHAFHTLCAARWLTRSARRSCPLCQQTVLDSASPCGTC